MYRISRIYATNYSWIHLVETMRLCISMKFTRKRNKQSKAFARYQYRADLADSSLFRAEIVHNGELYRNKAQGTNKNE